MGASALPLSELTVLANSQQLSHCQSFSDLLNILFYNLCSVYEFKFFKDLVLS